MGAADQDDGIFCDAVDVVRAEEHDHAGADLDARTSIPPAPHYFNYRKTSIYAGSNEIQHTIMAKMVLGL